jgi:flavin reductase (DIM6/NTAB) family NADH-FMN oxidoreductase RutF
MDEAVKKEVLRLFTYGLYAITTGDEERWNAFTANWVSQVSFDPPLVAVSVENDSVSLPIIRRSGHFAVNVYGAEQRDLSGTLGKTLAKSPEKLASVRTEIGETGCPVLTETLGWIECLVENEMPAGDSTLVLGRVVAARAYRPGEPLTMRAAGFRHAG